MTKTVAHMSFMRRTFQSEVGSPLPGDVKTKSNPMIPNMIDA